MAKFWTIMLWIAGALAILGAFGLTRLELSLLVMQVDALMLAVGVICILAAYFRQ